MSPQLEELLNRIYTLSRNHPNQENNQHIDGFLKLQFMG